MILKNPGLSLRMEGTVIFRDGQETQAHGGAVGDEFRRDHEWGWFPFREVFPFLQQCSTTFPARLGNIPVFAQISER